MSRQTMALRRLGMDCGNFQPSRPRIENSLWDGDASKQEIYCGHYEDKGPDEDC